MQPKSTPRAAIYCRVSSKAQEENASLPTQRERCAAYAAEHGYQIIETFQDVHSGAELFERPALTTLRAAIRRGAIDVLIVYAVDRLSRSQTHQGLILSECDHAGVTVEIVTEPLDATAAGRFLLSAKTFAAEIEREKIRERAMRGKAHRLQSGRLVFSNRDLYGYRRDTDTGRRVIEPTEAAIVRQVYGWYLDDQLGMLTIAKRLNAAGVPSPRSEADRPGALWAQFTVSRLLTLPEYKGETFAGRTRRSGGRRERRAEGEWLRLPEETTPAIVSPSRWAAAQARRQANTGAATRNARRPALLRGLIVCAVCGRQMSPELPAAGASMIYRCGSRKLPGGACGSQRVNAAEIEAWAWDQIREALADPAILIDELTRPSDAGDHLAADRLAVQRQIEKLDRQIAKLLRAFLDSDDEDAEDFKRERAALGRQRAILIETLDGLNARAAEGAATRARLDQIRAYVAELGPYLARADFSGKREMLELLGARVEASGADWTLRGAVLSPDRAGVVLSGSSAWTGHNDTALPFIRTTRAEAVAEAVGAAVAA